MKALILTGKRCFESRECADDAGDDDVSLDVLYCGICKVDAKMWDVGHRDLVLPRVLGHEICALDPTTGKRVVVWPGESCGCCYFCLTKAENLCESMRITGFHRDGGFAAKTTVSKDSIIELPEGVSSLHACFAEPIACCLNALEQLTFKANDETLIYGGGTLGLLMALCMKERQLVPHVVEISARKREKADAFRKLIDVEIRECEPVAHVHLAVNACGDPTVVSRGVKHLRPTGQFCLFSNPTSSSADETGNVDILRETHYRQLVLTGAYGCAKRHMEMALDVIKKYPEICDSLVEEVVSLEDVERVLPRVLSGERYKYIIKHME